MVSRLIRIADPFGSYPNAISKTIKTRLSNSYLIGEIFGMLFFGFTIDKFGRTTGIVFATAFLVFGIVLATASHGTSNLGLFWMMIVARGIAGFGAGGECKHCILTISSRTKADHMSTDPTCGTTSTEASDETATVRKQRGMLVAIATDFSIDLGFVVAGVLALIVLACYHNNASEGVWRVCYGLGIVASHAESGC